MPSLHLRAGSAPSPRGARVVTPRLLTPRLLALVGLVLVGLVLLGPAGLPRPAGAQNAGGPAVLHTTVTGTITPVIADHLDDALARAERDGYGALVVEIDTPGGLDSSMRAIIQGFLDAEVPVVVHVSPAGARAGSAGALITLAAHVAAMAPGTAIGASTPVDLEGGEVSDKVVNDAAAYAEAIADLRGRNPEVAVDMVREGRSLTVEQARDQDVIDIVATSLPDLLAQLDGRVVELGDDRGTVTLRTADARVDEHDMGFFHRVQQALADPNLAFLFLSLGTLGIIYELATPGVGAGGVVGVTLILLALFSLAVLPVDVVGLLLLLLAAAMFVAELFAPGVGVAAAGGTAALVLSGIFLFRDSSGVEVSLAVVAPVAAVVGGAVVVAGRLVLRARRSPSRLTGTGLLVGRNATVSRVGPTGGQAFVEGAWWNLRSTGAPLAEGARVRVVAMDGLDLVVEPVATPEDHEQGESHHE